PSGSHLLLVGDSDQLPSIGPGSVLADLLRVEAEPAGDAEVNGPGGSGHPVHKEMKSLRPARVRVALYHSPVR
ncbi:hypothetical protein ACWDTT_27740, partial [Streptosporangium sandarakinum]